MKYIFMIAAIPFVLVAAVVLGVIFAAAYMLVALNGIIKEIKKSDKQTPINYPFQEDEEVRHWIENCRN